MIYHFGACALDAEREMLQRGGEVVAIEPQVLRVLRYLLQHRGRLVSRDELLEQCWPETYVSDASLSNCMSRVREAIGQHRGGVALIQTVHRRGYCFVGEVREAASPLAPASPPDTALRPAGESASQVRVPLPESTAAPRADTGAATLLPLDEAGPVGGTPAGPTPSPAASLPTAMLERRHMSVLSCTLCHAEVLAAQSDPEDHYELMQRFVSSCEAAVSLYQGHIVQQSDEGVLVYFGYPQAHEDNALRAVRSGLALVATVGRELSARATPGPLLAVRVGIDSGMMISAAQVPPAMSPTLGGGRAATQARRLSTLAEPDTVVISAATYRLVEGYFTCKAAEEQPGPGGGPPTPAYRVLEARRVQSRLDVAAAKGLTPFVGRTQEVGLLLERWEQVKEGQGQVVLLSGEPGIGKSRLVQVLKEHIADEPHVWLECRSSPYYHHTALYPIIDLLQRTLQWHQEAAPDEKLAQLACLLQQYRLPVAETVPLLAALLSLPVPADRYPALALSPQQQRQKTLETVVAMVLEQAEHRPVLFVLEDLHWTDPTTLTFLDLLLDQTPTASIYTLLTCRPTFHPVWSHRSYVSQLTLNRLSHHHTAQIAEQVAGAKRLPGAIRAHIVAKTDGVPLFVEEMTKAVLESGLLQDVNGQYEAAASLTALVIPATLQDSLMARLDRLGTAKSLAQIGATIGRQFSYTLLQAVSQLDEATLHQELTRLVDAELLYRRGVPPQTTYLFKHALITEIAYQSLVKSTRQQYHQRIVQVLDRQFPEMAAQQPEVLAHHCTEAGFSEQAVHYWRQAGEHAVQRSAYVEAISHLRRALELLAGLPETSVRLQEQLHILVTLGPALMSIKGFSAPEVEQVYARARVLCQHVEGSQRLVPILAGLRQFYTIRGHFQIANELATQLLSLAQRMNDHQYLLDAHGALGSNLCFCGEFARSYDHARQGMALYEAQPHHALAVHSAINPGVHCLTWMATARLELGYPQQAVRHMHDALTLAQTLNHPVSVARALTGAALLHQRRREARATQETAAAGIALCTEHGFAQYRALSVITGGWALTAQGQAVEGIQQIIQGIADWRATGSTVLLPVWYAYLAEGYRLTGQIDDGLRTLSEALALVETSGERRWEAELHRLTGELLLAQCADNHAQAETCFRHATDIAQSQSAKCWELRAVTSLARLWQSGGKRQDAYDLLAPVYGWFTEGFDTADLQEARALLDELSL